MSNWSPLFSDITESSLWDEPLHVRVAFLTILARKSHRTHMVHMDVRRLAKAANISMEDAEDAVKVLSSPDPNSLSEIEEGRRILKKDGGWLVVNGEYYKNKIKEVEARSDGAERQARWREKQKANGAVPQGTPAAKPERPELFMPTSVQLRLGALFRRKATTPWSPGEMKAFKAIGDIAEEDLAKLEAYYRAKLPENTMDIRRRDLVTMLNNFSGEMDRARSFKGNTYL